ncbi:hypothetical protein C0995_009870 [Termitomyces sp. Mi166|nr:hypothetical protein C0995_009870 [Termitomyces sp. Mi166\
MGPTTLEGIMSRLPSTTKLLHAEIVLRTDPRSNFMNMRRKIQQNATQHISDRRKKDGASDEFGKQEIAFHGTPRRNVGSIVKSGFVVLGQKTANGEKVVVRRGYTWGMVDTSFNVRKKLLNKAKGAGKSRRRRLPGQKLIVCAAVMGRRRLMTHTGCLNPTVEEGYDSHVSPSQLEYIVFNSHQILRQHSMYYTFAKTESTQN